MINENKNSFHDNFQVLKPVIVEKGKTVVGHANSDVSRYEEEIERLRNRIKELESKEKPVKVKKTNVCKEDCDDDYGEDAFFDALRERTTDVRRNKRSTGRRK